MRETDQLVADPHEPRHLLIRHRDEPASRAPVAAVEAHRLLVLATPGAQAAPSLADDLVELLRGSQAGVESLWIAIPGLAESGDVVRRIADELDVEVVAPDGGVVSAPGAALYAGRGVGGTGWFRFEPGCEPVFHGARFPLPEWEVWLPDELPGAAPAPCGLVIGDVPGDDAFGVPVNQRFPKVVVGASAPEVAEVLGGLPDHPVMLVPAAPDSGWFAELARLLGREVVFSAGMQARTRTGAVSTFVPDGSGGRLFRPFPLVLRQGPDGGPQTVLDIAASPPGWTREGPRSYRSGDVLAEVVPSGLALRSTTDEPTPQSAPFDPRGWTLTVGTPGQVIALPVLEAAEHLLTALPTEQRTAATVRLAGPVDETAAYALDPTLRNTPPPPPQPPASAPRPTLRAPAPAPSPALQSPVPPSPVVVATPQPPTQAAPPAVLDAPAPTPPITPISRPVITTTASPPITVTTSSSAPSAPAGATDSPTPPESTRDKPPAASDTPKEADPVPATDLPLPPPIMTTSGAPVSTLPSRSTTPTPTPTPTPVPHVRALEVKARASTAAEQARFTAAAGDYFSEALATVNAAMATWPSMRVDESPGVKADYVAVCLFLGRGVGDALSLNAAVKGGREGELDAQVACLMSGIRRLPTQRRAVLRQGKVAESLEHRSAPGTVLTEPGFLAASVDLDITVPGADLDVLIWPSTARRTSELVLGRPVDEALFLAGARFKALAVRTAGDGAEDDAEDEGEVTAPRVAVLYRELAPGEMPTTTDLDERDLAVLAKLDGVLERRHRNGLRLVDDPGIVARLTTSMVVWQRETATAVAS